jgi:pseudaminic acid biosynthesis-associated methylase
VKAEFDRLEHLFRGEFENEYVERHKDTRNERRPFWHEFLQRYPIERALEVGCGMGFNLRWIAENVAPCDIYGVDINDLALSELRQRLPGVNALWGRAWDLPLRARHFDLVFTAGLLMHQSPETLVPVISEMLRCACKYVLCIEYFGEREEEIPYRGIPRVLFRRDYEHVFREHFPTLRLLEKGLLGRAAGWDDVTWWLFQTP